MTNENEQLKRLLKFFIKEYCELFWSECGTGARFKGDPITDPIDYEALLKEDEKIIFSFMKEIVKESSGYLYTDTWEELLSQKLKE